MKRNLGTYLDPTVSALSDRMVWAPPPAPDIFIAGCIDDKALPENELLLHLSDVESVKAQALTDQDERRHFIFRRCFQRLFLAEIVGWQGQLRDLKIEHTLDSPPKSPDAPSYQLSFSSTGTTVLACAASNHVVGVDVEKLRPIDNAAGLSKRFFSPREAETIALLAKNEQELAFLHYWAAKEAGLKAIGKGIVSGLNSFVVSSNDKNYVIEFTSESETSHPWNLQYLDFLPHHIVAIVHRRST
jgi:4'-phosphopantetheinyl transferase